jgi:RNA polymerase sigma factor (sigma-70 family)
MSVGIEPSTGQDGRRPWQLIEGAPEPELAEALAVFLGERRRLTAIASRILRSRSEAEDVVQEVWLRWQQTDLTTVGNARALLVTMTTRRAINVKRSARRRHETYGPAAPDVADPNANPVARIEQGEALEEAVALVLTRLTANERAAYILRELFDYPYDRIGVLLRLSPVYTRQLVCRARRHLAADRPGVVSPAHHRRFLRTFLDATRGGNLTGLEDLLSERTATPCLTE